MSKGGFRRYQGEKVVSADSKAQYNWTESNHIINLKLTNLSWTAVDREDTKYTKKIKR